MGINENKFNMRISLGIYQRAAIALIAIFAFLASLYSVINPIWEAPDETDHVEFVLHLLRERTLPVLREGGHGEDHQPPLYYLIAAVPAALVDLRDAAAQSLGHFQFNIMLEGVGMGDTDKNHGLHFTDETFPWRGLVLVVHVMRFASVLLAAGTVAFVIGIGWLLFPNRRAVGLLAGALVAFNPQFLFISGSANNDNALTLAATGTLWQLLRAIKHPTQWRQWVFVGLWLSAGVLSKLNIVTLVPVVALALIVCAVRARSFKVLLMGGLSITLTLLLSTGWWLLRNIQLYGDPAGWSAFNRIYSQSLARSRAQFATLFEFWVAQFQSYWGMFGWANVPLPGWLYWVYATIVGLGVIGLVVWLIRRRYASLSFEQSLSLILLGCAVLIHEAYMTFAIVPWAQGRYFFPAIGALMIVLSLGLLELISRHRHIWACLTPLALIAAIVPFAVIRPAYRIAPSPKSVLWFAPNPTNYLFGNQIELRGYTWQISADKHELQLKLYWRATQKPDFDYSSFAHLIDAGDQVVAQEDQGPGKPLAYTPQHWQAEDIVVDTRTIQLPANLAGSYRLRIGLYNYQTSARLPVTTNGNPIGDFVVLQQIIEMR